jgi:Tol biopolymer transport system component
VGCLLFRGKQDNIFVIRVNGAELHKLTDGIHKDRMARWSPDGKQIAFFFGPQR